MSEDHQHPGGKALISRRSLLRSTMASGTVAVVPVIATSSCSSLPPVGTTPLTEKENATLTAFVDRIIPADESGPGASASGVPDYINNTLASWNIADIPLVREGLQALELSAVQGYGRSFALLTAEEQDFLVERFEKSWLDNMRDSGRAFNRLYRLTLEGMFSDPYYGGNRNYAGWDLIAYPGAVMGSTADMQRMGSRLPPLHTSAYGAEHDGDHTP
jgi:hypothetical protein